MMHKNLKIEEISKEIYFSLISMLGLKETWSILIAKIKQNGSDELSKTLFAFDNLSELYEMGLAFSNKDAKKAMGQYYTPIDVAQLMVKLLMENSKITTIADVACGTGNLIIEVIKYVQLKKSFDILEFIKQKRLYLYELDKTALSICLLKIELLLGENIDNYLNVINADFLNTSAVLPIGCSVISNPPYGKISNIRHDWSNQRVISQSLDLYAGFMDKIVEKCSSAVIISPQSFLVSNKYSILREHIGTAFEGEIYSFDNVPGTIFKGR